MKKLTKNNRKAAAAGALLLAIMLTSTACGDNADQPSGNENQGSASPTMEAGNQLPDESGVIDPEAPASDEGNAGANDPGDSGNGGVEQTESEPISAEGVFSGLSDSHTVEIITDGVAAAYQIPEKLTADIEALPADAKVKFEYIEKAIEGEETVKQLWLTKIEAVQ